jgi:hypothetical protein
MWNSDATGAWLLALAVASALAAAGCTAAEVGTCLRHSDCGSGRVCSDGTCVTQSHAPPADVDASSTADAAAVEAGDGGDGALQAEAATGEASEIDSSEAGAGDSDAAADMDADVEAAPGFDAQDDAAPDGS